jgi:hypothetical protein
METAATPTVTATIVSGETTPASIETAVATSSRVTVTSNVISAAVVVPVPAPGVA